MGLAHAGRSQQGDIGGLGDAGQVGQFLDQSLVDQPLVDGGLETEVELLQGALEGQVGQPGASGEVAFPTGGVFQRRCGLRPARRTGEASINGRVRFRV